VGRADVELVARGLAPSRSAAQRLIADGAVFRAAGVRVERAAQPVAAHDALWVASSDETRFVSRAGAKLAHALRETGLDVRGTAVLDAGMSTGGFAEALLEAGAARVVGIEVGHGQLHTRLRGDPRVACLERLNLREATRAVLAARLPDLPRDGFRAAVADLAFISLPKVLPALGGLLAPGADVLLLVKPQFELGPDARDARGVVADATARERAVDGVADACRRLGWSVRARVPSALPGGDGNLETFLLARVPTAPRPETLR